MGALPEGKITADKEAKDQLAILQAKSINKNPPVWEKTYSKSVKVFFHNIHSLRDKIEDIEADPLLPYADIIIYAETWLDTETNEDDSSIQLNSYKLHLNSCGRGKGLAVYCRQGKFSTTQYINDENLQISLIEAEDFNIVCLYRSDPDRSLATHLKNIIPPAGCCLVVGDFNICSMKHPDHEVFATLRSMHFNLLVSEATHFDGGHLDQAWLRSGTKVYSAQLYSPFYTCKDHDALLIALYDPRTEEGDNFILFQFFSFFYRC